MLAKHLGHAQHEVGRRSAFGELAGKPEADHLRHQHVDRLAEHDRLCFDAADSPAEDAEAVDHRGVGVGADERVGKERSVLVPDHFAEVLEVHLVDDPCRRWHDPEVVEGALAPLQELVPLAVALELLLAVDGQRHAAVERVHLHRVIDDEVAAHQRIDLGRVTAHPHHRGAHRGKVDNRRNPGEVL